MSKTDGQEEREWFIAKHRPDGLCLAQINISGGCEMAGFILAIAPLLLAVIAVLIGLGIVALAGLVLIARGVQYAYSRNRVQYKTRDRI